MSEKSNFFKKNGYVNFGNSILSFDDTIELASLCKKFYTKIKKMNPSTFKSNTHEFNKLIVHDIETASFINQILSNKDIKYFLDEILGQNFKIWDIGIRRSIPGDRGFLAWQRKIRYNLRNCPLFLYSREFLEDSLKKAGCFEISEITEIDRGYFVTIRK